MDAGDLRAGRVAARLRTRRFGRSLTILARAESTNDEARRAAEAGCADGHVVVADAQTAGRGSRGRAWASPAGTDLYVSIVARVQVELPRVALMTLATGLGVADTVDDVLRASRARVKWPNDVRIDGRKCAGILVETATDGMRAPAFCVIGIGLNVNRVEFPPELENIATSLRMVEGRALDRSEVLAALLGHIEQRVDELVTRGPGTTIAALRARLDLVGAEVRVDAARGRIHGVADDGALELMTDRGVVGVHAGTIEAV